MPSTKDWHTQLLRLTVFPSSMKSVEDLPDWESIVGNSPDQVTKQPKINILEELGQFGKGSLVYKMVPGRIDWIYRPFISDKQIPEGLPEIGIITDALEEFKPLMIKWLKECDALARVAFGAAMFFPVDSNEAAYVSLNDYIESVKIDPGTSDFLYQINRKRPSKTLGDKVMINRLSKWKAIKFNLQINEFELEELFACSLEIDINTMPSEQTIINKESLIDLFGELIELGLEIASKGDTP